MRHSAAILTMVVMASMAVLAQDQKPQFNAKWTKDAQKNGPSDNPFARGNQVFEIFEIKVDATTFTRSAVASDGTPSAMVYKLDGREATLTGAGGAQTRYTAKWEGNTIVIKTTSRPGAATRTTVYSMEGAWLVQETSSPTDGVTTRAQKVYYKKVP